jgi:hypothetical protein
MSDREECANQIDRLLVQIDVELTQLGGSKYEPRLREIRAELTALQTVARYSYQNAVAMTREKYVSFLAEYRRECAEARAESVTGPGDEERDWDAGGEEDDQ